ncbi:hypothetical protein FBEOM_8812 [Fusarium beomiforme]|uniref:Uncharacterized protein n=1 Tax=Fusarium beomiforme TaxID=44412 RepID=A0A9P5AEK8_9HYPO|nr:hypothetical protein FBEOM_8812 [Fusarium beomiforme]
MATNTEFTSENPSLVPSKTETSTPTVTKLITLSTPFEQPHGCDLNFIHTSVFPSGHSKSPVPILLSTHRPSCYPSGWEDVVRTSHFDFYPAVCPSGWIYYNMKTTTSKLSMAVCCNSGYTPLNGKDREIVLSDPLSTNSCGRWTQDPGPHAHATPRGTEADGTLMLHEPWTVYWNKADTSTLIPKLPTLTSDMLVPTWIPGDDIPDGKWDRTSPNDGPFSGVWGKFVLIGLPLIGLFIVAPNWEA